MPIPVLDATHACRHGRRQSALATGTTVPQSLAPGPLLDGIRQLAEGHRQGVAKPVFKCKCQSLKSFLQTSETDASPLDGGLL